MKKLLVGLLISMFLAVGGPAMGASVVKKDNFTYKISGDWQIQFRKEIGEDEDLDLEYDDLEIKNYAEYKINDTLTAFGHLDFGFKNAADKPDSDANPHLEEAYLGMKISSVKVYMGKTSSPNDDFGVAGTYETVIADDCFDEFANVDGDDLVAISAKIGEFVNIAAAYEIEAESEKSDGNGTFYDILVTADIKGLSFGIGYQNFEAAGSDIDESAYGVQVSYDAKVVAVGADYSVYDADNKDDEASIWNICVTVPLDVVEIVAGYVNLDYKEDAHEDEAGWYANVTYKFPTAKKVSLFAEIGDSDGEGEDIGYLAGMRLKF